jgi:hypothetical protein
MESLKLLRSVPLPGFPSRPTARCLASKKFLDKRDRLDVFGTVQPECVATTVGVFEYPDDKTFSDAFRIVLKLGPDAPLEEVERMLKQNHHAVSLQHLEMLVDMMWAGGTSAENAGMQGQGFPNYMPVVGRDGRIHVLSLHFYKTDQWCYMFYSLNHESISWTDMRLIISNMAQ